MYGGSGKGKEKKKGGKKNVHFTPTSTHYRERKIESSHFMPNVSEELSWVKPNIAEVGVDNMTTNQAKHLDFKIHKDMVCQC